MPKITRRVVEAMQPPPEPAELLVWDSELRGFGVRMMASGVASYLVKYRNSEGRQRKLVLGRVGTLTPEQARQIARDRLAEVARGDDPSARRRQLRHSITIAELCDRYLAEAKSFIKPTTWSTNESKIRRHVKPLIGSISVAGLTTADVARLQSDIIAGKTATKREKGRGGVTSGGRAAAARTLATLSIVLEYARTHGLVADNVALAVKKPPLRKRTRFLDFEEVARLGDALRREEVSGPQVGCAAIRFLLLSGCRRLEALTLRDRSVDRGAGCLRLSDTKSGPQVRPIGAAALAVLDDVTPRDGWVFPACRGDGHFVGAPKLLGRVAAAAGLDHVNVHALRHSYASAAAALGYSPAVIAGLLGHALGGVTGLYVHFPDPALVAAADRVAARLAAALAGDPAPP